MPWEKGDYMTEPGVLNQDRIVQPDFHDIASAATVSNDPVYGAIEICGSIRSFVV